MIDEIVQITVRDGTSIAARVYRPDGADKYPALFGAAPYRFDNNSLPASAQFLWRERFLPEWARGRGYREMASDAQLANEISYAAHRQAGYEEVDRVVQFRKAL